MSELANTIPFFLSFFVFLFVLGGQRAFWGSLVLALVVTALLRRILNRR